jgi:hypothetical protein
VLIRKFRDVCTLWLGLFFFLGSCGMVGWAVGIDFMNRMWNDDFRDALPHTVTQSCRA